MNYRQPVTDERIEAAITEAGVSPELCEWYGDPDRRITFRIELCMGRYAERTLTPFMDDEALAYYVGKTAGDLTRENA